MYVPGIPWRDLFNPLPTGLGALQTTSIDCIKFGSCLCSLSSAFKDATLTPSEPQNRIRKGSEMLRPEYTLQEIHACEIFGLLTKCLDQESMICLGEWRSLRNQKGA